MEQATAGVGGGTAGQGLGQYGSEDEGQIVTYAAGGGGGGPYGGKGGDAISDHDNSGTPFGGYGGSGGGGGGGTGNSDSFGANGGRGQGGQGVCVIEWNE